MATKKITFDPEAGAAYAANFAMLGGANFEGNFEVVGTYVWLVDVKTSFIL